MSKHLPDPQRDFPTSVPMWPRLSVKSLRFALGIGLISLTAAWVAPSFAKADEPAVEAPAKGEALEKDTAAETEDEDGGVSEKKVKDTVKQGMDAARLRSIKNLRIRLGKLARSPHVKKKLDEVHKILDALASLRGTEAGLAALRAAPILDEGVRNKAFALVEQYRDKSMVKILTKLLDDKRYRRDNDARMRFAHVLAVVDHPSAIEPLAELIRSDEPADVVAEAAQALAAYRSVPVKHKKEAVLRLLNLYASTRNLMMSVRPEDRIARAQATERYKVYGKTLRFTLQELTGQNLSDPRDWRRWWNDNKKARKWKPGSARPRRGS